MSSLSFGKGARNEKVDFLDVVGGFGGVDCGVGAR